MTEREKLTISLERDLLEAIRAEAETSGLGVSEWIAEAARREAKRAAAHRTLAEWEQTHGPLGGEG